MTAPQGQRQFELSTFSAVETAPLQKLALAGALGVLITLAGCAAPPQAALRPSPTGCYYRVQEVSLYGVIPTPQPRYEPAPWQCGNAMRLWRVRRIGATPHDAGIGNGNLSRPGSSG